MFHRTQYGPKTLLAKLFIDPNNGEFKGWTREHLSLYPIDYNTGEYTYPKSSPPPDNYWIESILKDGNLIWVMFITGIIYRFVNNLKIGKSCVLFKKMNFDKSIKNKERSWEEVFEFIFGRKTFGLTCLLPVDT